MGADVGASVALAGGVADGVEAHHVVWDGHAHGGVAHEHIAQAVGVGDLGGEVAVVVHAADVVLCAAVYVAEGTVAPIVLADGELSAYGAAEQAVVEDVDGTGGADGGDDASVALMEEQLAAAGDVRVPAQEVARGGIHDGQMLEVERVEVVEGELAVGGE